jgi:MFS family permease
VATGPAAKTVQDYIDERPVWSDGTPVSSAPLTAVQWRVWGLACAGKFFEGLVVFMTGVALPLIQLEFGLDATRRGLVGAATLFGILVGASALGGLSDRVGRKAMFVSEMLVFLVFLVLAASSHGFAWLLVSLFGLGLALGCDYPTAHLVISEAMPSRLRGRLVLSAFAFQAVGALAGTAVGLLVLQSRESVSDWRWMYATAVVPALLVLVGRFFVPRSAPWLAARGRIAEAERATQALLRRSPPYPRRVELRAAGPAPAGPPRPGFAALFSGKLRRATVLAAVPWFL